MKTRKMYLIVEVTTNKVLHITSDKYESMKMYGVIKKCNKNIMAKCSYQ